MCPYRNPSERNEAMGPAENQERTDVVIAAGGLGKRRPEWSRHLPKEFFPARGIPGIIHLMEEIARMGRVRDTMVHHPYYEDFILFWAGRALTDERGHDNTAGHRGYS